MLTIKDLTASKELDSKAMAGVSGGNHERMSSFGPFVLNIASPVNAPKQASLLGLAESYTGAQMNTNFQSDDDFNAVIGSGQVVNTGGNHNMTAQNAFSNANNTISSVQ
ncbi:MAG: hypothetical protein ACR2P1_09235 [Pseudomonadales bacterium]